MITETFYLKNKSRLVELQQTIKSSMPTCRFESNPYSIVDGRFFVSISYESQDLKPLRELQSKWHNLDNPPKKKLTLWKRITEAFSSDVEDVNESDLITSKSKQKNEWTINYLDDLF